MSKLRIVCPAPVTAAALPGAVMACARKWKAAQAARQTVDDVHHPAGTIAVIQVKIASLAPRIADPAPTIAEMAVVTPVNIVSIVPRIAAPARPSVAMVFARQKRLVPAAQTAGHAEWWL